MNESMTILLQRIEQYNQSHAAGITVYRDELLDTHTSFRIGGPADCFCIPADRAALTYLCQLLRETGIYAFFLGNGSNVLFDDVGFRGAVVSLSALNGVRVDEKRIIAEAGASLASVCKAARDAGLSGLEFAYGIPGSVGGAVTMNAGAYGGEIAHVLRESSYLDRATLETQTIPLADHAYGYRESVYKHSDRVILQAVFDLTPADPAEIDATMRDYMTRRVTKQPLEYPSAGSVFKRYPGRYTGQMIEEAGLKGYTIGGAQVSEKHAGFIINKGGATAADVSALIEHVRTVILQETGCALECEVLRIPSCNPFPKK